MAVTTPITDRPATQTASAVSTSISSALDSGKLAGAIAAATGQETDIFNSQAFYYVTSALQAYSTSPSASGKKPHLLMLHLLMTRLSSSSQGL